MLPVSRIASSFFALWAFSTTRLRFECCCGRFCFGNTRNKSQNFEFWLNAIQNLSFIICGSFIVFELSCYSILSKDWSAIKHLLHIHLSDLVSREAKPRPVCKPSRYIFVLKICKTCLSSKRSSSKRILFCHSGLSNTQKKESLVNKICGFPHLRLVSVWRCKVDING